MANAQWTQLGPGAGGQERAVQVYNNPATSKYDFYVGSDVSGVWRASSVDPLLLDDATQYDWQYISNNGIVRFINKFVPAENASFHKLLVAYRNGIGTIDLGGNTGMTNLWYQEDSWVSDIFVSTMSGNSANIYFITGTTRIKDEPGNFKNNATTKDLYMATYDISTNAFTINASYELPELGGEQSEYCLHVNDNGTFATTDDNLLIATETGLYNFGTNQLSNIPLAVPGPYNTKYYEPTSILQRSPNSLEYFITIYGMGLFSYNTNTKVWTNMITNLNAQNKNNGVYDDFVNNREYQNFTRLIRLPNNNGWVLMNEDNLVKYNNNNYYVGAFYSADNSGQPNGNWTALNVFDGITDDWGWNTSTPCSNVNSTILTPNNHLLAGKSGNIFVTRNALTNGTPLNTSWQGIYSCLQQNNGCETYRHKGYVNTAPKCIFNDDNNRVWLGMHDRLLWESDDNGSYFNELTAGCTYSLPNQPNANSTCNVPATNLTDCFFITKDPSTGANYAGVGAGYASKKGLGCVLQLIGNAWTQVGNSLCGDPVKMIFSDMHIYVLVNTIDGQTKLYGLNGATWDEVNFGSTLKIYDVLISPLGDVIYIIKSDNDGVHGYAITNSNFLDFSTSLGTPFIIPNIKLQAMKLIPCSSCANEYKIIAGAYPKNYTATYSNLYSIFADLSSGIALDGAGGTADIFKKLYIDNLDHTDDGINYIEINESLNRIYVSTVSFDYGNTSTPPTGKIYAADFDPIDASIAPTSWQDITANLPNKAIKYINSNGATCGNEFIYAVVRGLGAWRLGVDVNASGNISSTPFCINGTSTLTANLPPLYTANNYLWNTSETTAAITISAAGTYTVTVTGTGCGGTAISTYTQSIKVLAMDFNIKSFNTCTGSTGAATVIDNGMNHPLTYLWNGGSTLKSIANLGNTTYTVTITDNVGCSVTKTVSITNTTITIGTPTSTAAACSGTVGGTLNFTASGGTLPYTYTLSNGAFNLNGQFKNLAQGTFTVTVTDFNGCTATATGSVSTAGIYTIGDPVGIYNLNSITVANNLTLSGYTLYATTSTTNITVPTATALTLNTGTAIRGCTSWQGIINNGTVSTDNASVEDADVAINVGANAKYYLTNTSFLNNKLSISAINTNLLNCTIDQCSFDNTKLPPFSNQLPASHLQYNNVTNLEIGSTLNNKPNIFKHAQTAIYVTNSDLKIFNSNFTEIGFDSYEADVVPPVLIRQGYGIAATNTTANAFNIVVDKNQLLNPNSFLNCNHAVYVKGRYNTTIANNNYDRCTTGNYCSYHDLATNNITIADNKFTQCINPIHCYNNPTSTIAITDNLINMQSATTALPYSAINYGNRAIVLREVKGTINLNVTGNKMSNISEGIYCINVKGAAQGDVTIGALNADPNIFSNEYIITTPQVNLLNRTHYGINLINCQLINLLGNRAKWSFTPTVAAQDVLRGISLMDCKSLFVVQNKTEKLGTGIRYWGDCTMGQLKCNTMTSCYQSVYLDPVGVNNKISDVGAWSGSAATSTSWKNRWVTPKHNLNYRVDGAAAQGFIINWTWDIANTIGDLKPVPHEPNVIKDRQCNNTATDCEPPTIAPDDDAQRMALYGKAVGDSTYYDYVEPEFKYNDKTAYYYSAASDSSILYQGNANDAAFISEFDSLSNTNVGLLYDAEQALNNNDYTTMQTRLSSMVNKNTIEQNKSEALNYYVDYVAKDSIADSASVFNLKNKGYQHPFLGGDAVYWIRAMFDIEHEDQMPQLRKWNLYKQKYKLPINFILFPNLASDLVTISFEGDDDVIDIMCNIYDAYGKLVLNHKFAKSDFTFSTSIFNAGIYYVRLLQNSNELASKKLILIKK